MVQLKREYSNTMVVPNSTVLESLTRIEKIQGSNPTTGTEREILATQINSKDCLQKSLTFKKALITLQCNRKLSLVSIKPYRGQL